MAVTRSHRSNSRQNTQLLALAAVSALAGSVYAADVLKLDDALTLNTPTAWSTNLAPTALDVAVYDSLITSGPLSNDLGANATWGGIRIGSPAGPVTITGTSSLTIGRYGIDLSSASQNLTMAAPLFTATDVGQTWAANGGRTFTLSGALTRGAGSSVYFNTIGGTINIASGTASAMLTQATTGAAWGVVNNGIQYDFAALDASKNVVPGSTVLTYNVPTGSGNITVSGTLTGPLDVVNGTGIRLGNTTTVTGGGVRFNTSGAVNLDTSTSGRLLTTGGVLVTPNIGIATVTIGGGANSGMRPGGNIAGGEFFIHQYNTDGALLLNNGGQVINNTNSNNLTKTGPGLVIINTNSMGISGNWRVQGGTVQFGNNTGSGNFSGGTLINNGAVVWNRSDTAGVYAGVLAGAGTYIVNNASAGAIAITGTANTFTGPLEVNSGAVILNNIGNLGATSGVNVNNGTLTHATASAADISAKTIKFVGNATINTNGNDVTYANGIGGGGSGGLTKMGNGVLTLTGNNTYTGNTTVVGGTLRISNTTGSHPGNVQVNTGAAIGGVGTIAGATTVASGGILAPGAGAVGTLATGSLDLQSGSTAVFEFNSTPNNDKVVVTQSGGLTLNGGAFTLYDEGTTNPFSTAGAYDLIQYSGAIGGSGTSALSVANVQPGKNYAFSATGGFVKLTISTAGVVTKWITDGPGDWGTGTNWDNGSPNVVGATVNFTTALTSPSTVTLEAPKTAGALVFQSANGYTLAGSALTLNNGTSLGAMSVFAGNHTISAPVVLTGNTQVSTVASSSLALTNTVSGAVTVSKNGPGTLVMSGSNSFSGGVQLNDGTIGLGHSKALGTGDVNINATSALRADADNLNIANNINISPALTTTLDVGSFTTTLSGSAFGYGNVVKAGTGTLVLANSMNLSSASFTLAAGTLQIGTGGTTGDLSAPIVNNGVVVLNRSDDLNFGNNVSGTGMFIKAANNTATLTTGMTYTGDTRITGGKLVVGDTQALATSTLDYDYAGTLSFGGNTAATLGGLKGSKDLPLLNDSSSPVALTVGTANGVGTYTGVMSGTGATLTKIGSGTLTLTKPQTYTGGTVIGTTNTGQTGGVLELATGADVMAGPVNFTGGAGATLLISGGKHTQTGVFNGTWGNTIRVTAGTFAADGLTQNTQAIAGQNSNTLLRVDGGVVNLGTFLSDRSALALTAEPVAGSDVAGIYVTGGKLNISGTVGICYDAGANSTNNMRIDGGEINIAGTTTLTINNGGRWSIIDVNGGTLNLTDTVNGLVFGGGGDNVAAATTNWHSSGNNTLVIRNTGIANIERIQLGVGTRTDGSGATVTYTGTQVVNVLGGGLYIGSGGIVDINEVTAGTTAVSTTNVIRMGNATAGGVLGANADWSSRQPIDLRNNTALSVIKAADFNGVAHNITLSGVASGTGGFNKTGAGTVTMTGLNTYAGNTTVTAGTLVLGPQAQAPVLTGAGAVLNGGKLVMQYSGTSPGTVLNTEILNNSTTGFQAGKVRTSLAVDSTKAIGWLDDGTSTYQARYTYKGDINLSGTVDSTDFNTFVALGNYGMTSGAIWANGDTDYDGKVNSVDFNYLAGNFGLAPITAPLPAPSLGAVVPEPSMLGLIGLGAATLVSRRRRQAR